MLPHLLTGGEVSRVRPGFLRPRALIRGSKARENSPNARGPPKRNTEMILPIGDDNTGRTTAPVVNYAIIALNLLVFVFLQGMGTNERFTYAFSTVPEEIVTGRDVVTRDRVVEEPLTHERFKVPGLQPTPGSVYLTLLASMFMH